MTVVRKRGARAPWREWVAARELTYVIRVSEGEFEQDTSKARAFTAAYQQLVRSGVLGRLVALHGDMGHCMHSGMPSGTQRFLAWHRIFLYVLEAALMAVDSSVTLPYWDWTNRRSVPGWLAYFSPDVWVPTYKDGVTPSPHRAHNVVVSRDPGASSDFYPFDSADGLPTTTMVNTVLQQTSYMTFTQPNADFDSHYKSPFGLEGIHNAVHDWVGGSMADGSLGFGESPVDVLFWLHHANVDRLWAQWQTANPGVYPPLRGSDTQMDPWYDPATGHFTEKDTRDTRLLNYVYV